MLCAGITLLMGCATREHKATTKTIAGFETDLLTSSKGIEVGQQVASYEVLFVLDAIPTNPAINMTFKVKSTGICLHSYLYTTLHVNDTLVKSIDFRELAVDSKQTMTVPINPLILKQGKNTLRLVTGDCSYDIDSLQLDKLDLVLKK